MKRYHVVIGAIFSGILLAIMIFMGIIILIQYNIYRSAQENKSSTQAEVIVWNDKALEAAIKNQMDVPMEYDIKVTFANEYIWPGGMFILEGEDIESIEDLKYFKNLRHLVLRDTSISDLHPLLFIEKFVDLEIYGGKADLDAIVKMENLEYLKLYDFPIKSIEPLKELSNLRWLKIGGLPLDDISILKSMPKINTITLERLPVTDISALLYLRGLSSLEIIDTPVAELPPLLSDSLEFLTLIKTDISDISDIPDSVRRIKLEDNQILDFSPLCSLTNLSSLEIRDADLSNIMSPLSFPNLKDLSIIRCRLSNLSFLGNCAELYFIDLSDNELESIVGIDRFASLGALCLSNNKLQSIDNVRVIPYLEQLDLSDNPVQDLTPLAAIQSLTRLELSGIDLKDVQLDKLLNAPDLGVLNVSGCGLKDINFINKFRGLHSLDISNNQIYDISEIKYMFAAVNEVQLDLSYNPIADLTPLENCTKISELNLSGIDLANIKGLEALQNIDIIMKLTAKNCNIERLQQIRALAEANIHKLCLLNNRIKDLSMFITEEWDTYELNVSDNFITDKYILQGGAVKVSPGLYRIEQYKYIRIQKEK